MNFIYKNNKIEELNDLSFYQEGLEAVEKSLNIAKSINQPLNKNYDIFVYWIGDNVNYKHSVVIKSFLATQNIENCKLKIYSDKDISKKECFEMYKNFEQVEFHIFDVEKEIIGTKFENFRYTQHIKNHLYNPAYESDFFRILMLHKYGGFYIDFDVLLLRDLSPLTEYDFLYQWGGYPNHMINGAIMHLNKNSISNNLLTDYLLIRDTRPGIGSVYWASDLYIDVKRQLPELVIFPSAFFNSEWQSNCQVNTNYLLEPLKKHEYSEMMYEGAFTWHWHNRWNEKIESGSKFDILDKKITKLLENKVYI
jgi:hypothetical protein